MLFEIQRLMDTDKHGFFNHETDEINETHETNRTGILTEGNEGNEGGRETGNFTADERG